MIKEEVIAARAESAAAIDTWIKASIEATNHRVAVKYSYRKNEAILKALAKKLGLDIPPVAEEEEVSAAPVVDESYDLSYTYV